MPLLSPRERWALAPPFHPYPDALGRSVFCGTFPEVTLGGRYPRPCPAETGLSSSGLLPPTRSPGFPASRWYPHQVLTLDPILRTDRCCRYTMRAYMAWSPRFALDPRRFRAPRANCCEHPLQNLGTPGRSSTRDSKFEASCDVVSPRGYFGSRGPSRTASSCFSGKHAVPYITLE